MAIDILSWIGVGLGAHSVGSGINQGKYLNQMNTKLETIHQDISRINDLLLPQKSLLLPKKSYDSLITDIIEIKKAIKEIGNEQDTTFISGQVTLPKHTENAMLDDPWYFLKESRPLKGAKLIKEGHVPVIYYYEGIKFVGWKEVTSLEYSFNFKLDSKTGLLLPNKFFNIKRNAKCPCGSQKRYKHCCGKI